MAFIPRGCSVFPKFMHVVGHMSRLRYVVVEGAGAPRPDGKRQPTR
jgi:hypothetical protein